MNMLHHLCPINNLLETVFVYNLKQNIILKCYEIKNVVLFLSTYFLSF